MSEKDFLSQFSSDGKKPDSFKEEERVKIEKPKKKIDPKWFIIAGAVLVALGVLSYFLFFAPKIEMPNFVGQTKNDVADWVKQQEISTSGIVFKEEYNFDNDQDVILSQSVEAGKKVKNNVKITFNISLGADPDEKISVPDLKSMNKSEIEAWISQNKLSKTKITTSYNDTYEKDSVISYEIKGVDEADFTRSSTLNISISKGPQPAGTVTVSDFKDKYYSEVESWAKTNKINLEKIEVYSDKVDVDKIVTQSIEANKTMKQNETLTVTVSKGKGIKVPDIYSMDEDQIEAWAKKNGISPTITSKYSNSDSHVLSSNVKAGQTISANDDVQIVLNAGNYFYANDDTLKMPKLVGTSIYEVEDWCNSVRNKGIDAYVGNWSGSSEVYSSEYSKGKIVSVEISSYSTGKIYDINDRLPLDVRFSVVVSKGMYYKLDEIFDKETTPTVEEAATVSDLIKVLSDKKISFTLASDITTDDYNAPARIAGKSTTDDLYDDQTYVIEKASGSYWKLKSAPTNNTGSGSEE